MSVCYWLVGWFSILHPLLIIFLVKVHFFMLLLGTLGQPPQTMDNAPLSPRFSRTYLLRKTFILQKLLSGESEDAHKQEICTSHYIQYH